MATIESTEPSPREAVTVRLSLEPVYNALNTLALLGEASRRRGLNAWVVRTARTLTPGQQQRQRVIFEGLRDVLPPPRAPATFEAYLEQLEQEDPWALRERALSRLQGRFMRYANAAAARAEPPVAPLLERLLSDVEAYLSCLAYTQPDGTFDAALHREAHALLNDPPVMRRYISDHLKDLWTKALASEWRRVQPALQWQVEMFARHLNEAAPPAENFRRLTGRELPSAIALRLAHARQVVLVPSWHTGRQITCWESDDGLRLFFSEPPNYDLAVLEAAPVGRAELRARLAALADETRLRILELLTSCDELSAQEIIAALGLSQSNVSRHLKQLVSLGYLYERRSGSAVKTYRLSALYFARTAAALLRLTVPPEQASTESSAGPRRPELERFLDRHGRLCVWPPARLRDKLLILEYLAGFFTPGRIYSEREVNEILLRQSAMGDSAALRRALCEFRLLKRTQDGARYWLNDHPLPEEGEAIPDSTRPDEES